MNLVFKAYEEGLKRVSECKKILGDTATIDLVAGNQEEPAKIISIHGFFDVVKLPKICEILRAPYNAPHKDTDTGTIGANYTTPNSCILCTNSETNSDPNLDWWLRCKKGKRITDVSEGCNEHKAMEPLSW